jgi:hypothetical protein
VQVGAPEQVNQASVIESAFQSADSVGPGDSVTFEVQARDPENQALTFAWSASAGTLGPANNAASASNVTWTAPPTGGIATVSLQVTDETGASTTQSFSVSVSNTGNRLFDDFSGSSIDSSKWTIATPRPDSQVFLAGGQLVLSALGYANTVSEFDPLVAKVVIRARFTMNNQFESLTIITRSDFELGGADYVHNGLRVTIGCLYDHALAIARMENGQFGVTLASAPWMASSLTHDVIVTDDGNQMQVFLDGSLALSAADSTRFARNFVTLADRPNDGWMNNSTQIDYVEIYTE